MTKKQAERYAWLVGATGLDTATLDRLLRIERTLSRWAEREAGDGSDWAIERDETTNKPFMVYHGGRWIDGAFVATPRRYPIADKETGALKRAAAIAAAHGRKVYHQGDCRGCSLYLYRPEVLDKGGLCEGQKIESCYSQAGVAICID